MNNGPLMIAVSRQQPLPSAEALVRPVASQTALGTQVGAMEI